MAVALGDLDADGDLDAVAANAPADGESQPSQVWLNDGAGVFTGTAQLFAVSNPADVALGDLNGDGALDIYFANGRWSQLDQIWLNDGAATFYSSGQAFGGENTANVSLGDVDGDGDLDAVLGNLGPESIWLNDGAAGFRLSDQRLGTDCPDAVSSGALGDLDGDGDPRRLLRQPQLRGEPAAMPER